MRNRVKELRMVRAGDLIPFAHNWRTHPDGQRKAVAASIEELGYFSPVEAWTNADGKLTLLDGHLRQELIAADIGPDTEIPVVILDLTEEEAKKAILIKDPLAGMAEANEELLTELLAEVDLSNDEWAEISARLNALSGMDDPVEEWQGMPEFEQEDQTSFQCIRVHLKDQGCVDKFAQAIGHPLGKSTHSIWYPKEEREDRAAEQWTDG